MKKIFLFLLFLSSIFVLEKKADAQNFTYIYNPISERYYITSTSYITDTTVSGINFFKLGVPLWAQYININSKIFLKDTTINSQLSLLIDRPLFFTNVPSQGFLRGAWLIDTSISGEKIKPNSVNMENLTSGAKDTLLGGSNLGAINSRLSNIESRYNSRFNSDGTPKMNLVDTSIFTVNNGKVELRDGKLPPNKIDTSLTPNFKIDTSGNLTFRYDTVFFAETNGSVFPKQIAYVFWNDSVASIDDRYVSKMYYTARHDTLGYAFDKGGYVLGISVKFWNGTTGSVDFLNPFTLGASRFEAFDQLNIKYYHNLSDALLLIKNGITINGDFTGIPSGNGPAIFSIKVVLDP